MNWTHYLCLFAGLGIGGTIALSCWVRSLLEELRTDWQDDDGDGDDEGDEPADSPQDHFRRELRHTRN